MNITDKGLDKVIQSLERLEGNLDNKVDRALYLAAGQIADEVKSGLQSIPIHENDYGRSPWVKNGQKLNGITATEKADLLGGFGIAHFRKGDGYVETSIGFTGNGSVPTKKYPSGVPNRVLMRTVESGNSIRRKIPVIRPAVNRVKKRAEETIKQELIKQIKEEI